MKIKKQLSTIGNVAILSLCLATGLVLNSPQTTLALQEKDVCGKVQATGGYAGVGGETAHYLIFICGSKSRTYYFSKDKRDGSNIGIKGTEMKPGEKYIFRSGKYTYTVTNKVLTITKNGKVVIQETFLNGGLYPND